MRTTICWTVCALALLIAVSAVAQDPYPGATLVATAGDTETQLIDADGTVLQSWTGAARPTSSAYSLGNGEILRPCEDPSSPFGGGGGGSGGRIQRIDGSNQVVWDYFFSTADYKQHHDIEPMPNGNVLIIAWERVSNAEVVAAGRLNVSGVMWPTLIAEVQPVGPTGGNLVWQWRAWDHLIQDVDPAKDNYGVVADHPERIDVNAGSVNPSGDWIHANSIDYDPVRDLIVFSSRSFNEFFVIDHGTTTAEAAGSTGGARGRGGDILYRWGNPQNYNRGNLADQYFYVIHGANFVDEGYPGAGNILAFDNGNRPGTNDDYSSAVEVAAPWNGNGYDLAPGEPYGPSTPTWSYGAPGDFYGGPTQCGAYRMPNGNTRITSRAEDRIFEVTPAGQIVWDYTHPGGVLRALWVEAVGTNAPTGGRAGEALTAAPNPFAAGTRFSLSAEAAASPAPIEIVSVTGQRIATVERAAGGSAAWDGRDDQGRLVAAGIYFARIVLAERTETTRLTVLR